MLRISKLADYGTVIMVYLARHPDILCSTRDIAAHTHLSVPTVSKLLKRLTNAKLLNSIRGVNGGYRLQRKTEEISVAEIIEALDEQPQHGLTECSLEPNPCTLQQVCPVQRNWRVLNRVLENTLAKVNLAMLAEPSLVEFERLFHGVVSGH